MTESPAMRLVKMVQGCTRVRSRQKEVQIIHEALYLAVRAGLDFDPDDMSQLQWWMYTDDGGVGEHLYAVAAAEGNISACQSFEKMKGRKPFIIKGRRLAVGTYIWRDDRQWKVTSFTSDGQIIICTHKKHDPARYERVRVDRRSRLTHADFRAAVKAGEFTYLYPHPRRP